MDVALATSIRRALAQNVGAVLVALLFALVAVGHALALRILLLTGLAAVAVLPLRGVIAGRETRDGERATCRREPDAEDEGGDESETGAPELGAPPLLSIAAGRTAQAIEGGVGRRIATSAEPLLEGARVKSIVMHTPHTESRGVFRHRLFERIRACSGSAAPADRPRVSDVRSGRAERQTLRST